MNARRKLWWTLSIVVLALVTLAAGYQLKQKLSADVICSPGYGYGSDTTGYGYSIPVCYDTGYSYGDDYGYGYGYGNGPFDPGCIHRFCEQGFPGYSADSFDDALGRIQVAIDVAQATGWMHEATQWARTLELNAKDEEDTRFFFEILEMGSGNQISQALNTHTKRLTAIGKTLEVNLNRAQATYKKRMKQLAAAQTVQPTVTSVTPSTFTTAQVRKGATITISGSGFTNGMLVFGDYPSGKKIRPQTMSSTSMTVRVMDVVANQNAGTHSIHVTANDGQSVDTSRGRTFQITQPQRPNRPFKENDR